MAVKTNITIDQGATFSTTIFLKDDNGDPIDLNGYTSSAAMRRWYTSPTAIAFNTSINTTAGSITLEMDDTISANLYPGRYVYDASITDGITVSRVVEGIATLTPAVTANTILTSNT
jgi:hypothetical protein